MNDNSWVLVHDSVSQELSGKLDAESVRATSAALSRLAALVLPVFCMKKRDIDSPNRDQLVRLHPFRLVHGITPDNVPTRVIVVRLQSPRTC